MEEAERWLSAEMAPPDRPDGLLEEIVYARGFLRVAGLDEAGRGPLAGPVVAAAVVLPRGVAHPDLQDSKLLGAKKREELAAWTKRHCRGWGLGVIDADEIDRVNILRASLLAMAEAALKIEPLPDCLLIDGNQKIPVEFLRSVQAVQQVHNGLDGLKRIEPLPFQRAIPKGDRRSVSIAAASILAKVARDELMLKYHRLYPEYGFGRHKGYACPSHLDAIARHGPSPIHRQSFSPIRERLGGEPREPAAPLFRKG